MGHWVSKDGVDSVVVRAEDWALIGEALLSGADDDQRAEALELWDEYRAHPASRRASSLP